MQCGPRPVPLSAQIVYFLAGLTCDDENFINKAGAQVCPLLQPRWWLSAQNHPAHSPSTRLKHLKQCEALCDAAFAIYTPPSARGCLLPQRTAAALGVALVCPDTSPRGIGMEGEDESWDFGVGAGFYVNATQVCRMPRRPLPTSACWPGRKEKCWGSWSHPCAGS